MSAQVLAWLFRQIEAPAAVNRGIIALLVDALLDGLREVAAAGPLSRSGAAAHIAGAGARFAGELDLGVRIRALLGLGGAVEAACSLDDARERGDALVEGVADLAIAAAAALAERRESALIERADRAEGRLVERETMATLGELVPGVAHELASPLGVAVSASSLMRDRAASLGKALEAGHVRPRGLAAAVDDLRVAADLTLANLTRATEMITRFKQAAVDRSHRVRRRVQLDDHLREILHVLSPLHRGSGHAIALELEPLEVEVDPGAVAQIVGNLLQNAVIHAFGADIRGTVTIGLRRVEPSIAELTFADDGRGLGEDERARVFEPFYTTRRGQGGSGLGLHIVRVLVQEVLEGTIDVAGAPGVGTAFQLLFPIAPRSSGERRRRES